MFLSRIRPRSLITTQSLVRSLAAAPKGRQSAAVADDDMEQGFALELKKVKATVGEMYELPRVREEPSPEFMEELTRVGVKYNKESNKEDAALKLDLETKIVLKNEAISALPKNFEGCRLHFDSLTSPLDRTAPTDTPPIPGFKLFKDEAAWGKVVCCKKLVWL